MSNNFGCCCFVMPIFSGYSAWFDHLCSSCVPRGYMASQLNLPVVIWSTGRESDCPLPTVLPLETSGARSTASIRNVPWSFRGLPRSSCQVLLALLHCPLLPALLPPSFPPSLPLLSDESFKSWYMAPKETVLDFQNYMDFGNYIKALRSNFLQSGGYRLLFWRANWIW